MFFLIFVIFIVIIIEKKTVPRVKILFEIFLIITQKPPYKSIIGGFCYFYNLS